MKEVEEYNKALRDLIKAIDKTASITAKNFGSLIESGKRLENTLSDINYFGYKQGVNMKKLQSERDRLNSRRINPIK